MTGFCVLFLIWQNLQALHNWYLQYCPMYSVSTQSTWGNIADTNYAELEDFARSKKAHKNLSWELLVKPESETLLLFRKLSPSFLPDKYKPKDPDSMRKHHERMNRMHNMGIEKPQGPVIRFFLQGQRNTPVQSKGSFNIYGT
eukprot:TRINITY_DN51824_c0_g1_i1.p5 TRINITY_DN51824_c0_g1~~TRINITY_DN51824_c0_g1_i1.p5  ORF type:complete len:143 (-),score=32.80 TRINITY_DN51824_c0_g1_i1:356-784(-)